MKKYYQKWKLFKAEKNCIIFRISFKGFKGTVVNRALFSSEGSSIEITLTIILKIGKQYLKTGKQYLKIGKQYLKIEKQYLEIGKQYLKIGKMYLKIGKQYLKIGKQYLKIGKQYLK